MKLKVCQICKLFLLLTVFCAELNYLKSYFCSALLMKSNNIVPKNYEELPVAVLTITRSSLITKSDAAKINQFNNKNKLSNKLHSKYFPFIITTKAALEISEAIEETTTTTTTATATSENVLRGIKGYLNLNESLHLYSERVRAKSNAKTKAKRKRKKTIILKNIKKKKYENDSVKAINVKQKLLSTLLPMRQKRQGRRQLEMRHSFDPVNKQKISQKHVQSQQSQDEQVHRVAILMPTSVLNYIPVQQGFLDFVEFFQVNLHNVSFDFIHDNNSNGFISMLGNHKYTTVVKTLNTNLPLDFDPTETIRLQNDPLSRAIPSLSGNSGYCNLAESLSQEFNKSVLVWPCPRMKEPSNFLPSFEAISFAVQSIATKLNWSQVDIYVGDENWGLPLAIAANLHRPYKIVIEGELRGLHAEDKAGKAIIITADMNEASTLGLLQQLESLKDTKVLLIDYVAASFNAENRFYKNLARLPPTSYIMSNLLLLTVLSDKYRHFLNLAYDDTDMEIVQNFRQLRRWKATITSGRNSSIKQKSHKMRSDHSSIINWPKHLDMLHDALPANTFISVLAASIDNSTSSVLADVGGWVVVSQCPELNRSATHIVDICQRVEQLALNCANIVATSTYEKVNEQQQQQQQQQPQDKVAEKEEEDELNEKKEMARELQYILNSVCQSQPLTSNYAADEKLNFTQGLYANNKQQKQIKSLSNFIDFFHLYDFLIANAFHTSTRFQQQNLTKSTKSPIIKTKSAASVGKSSYGNVPKYDFIVLDVVRERIYESAFDKNSSENSKQYNGMNNLNNTFKWRPLLILEQHEINLKNYITHSIQPGYDDSLMANKAMLWHCDAICWTIISISFGILLIVMAAGIAAGVAMRNYLLKNRLTKGPNKIVLSANDFVFPVDSRRVDEGIEAMLCCWLQQLQEFGGPEVDKPDLLKGSIGSLKNLGLVVPGLTSNGASITASTAANGKQNSRVHRLARHNPALLDMRARYNGDLVQLKEIPLNGSAELKSKAMDLLVMAHGLRHENINPLIGWLSDPNRTAMVFDYCSRGSLQDVLIMDEIKLDWSFRLSLLTDLVRGMKYLHASPVRVHGTLSSRNCVVDARWVLKVTDYGVASFYEGQNISHPQRTAKELLWTAPELLRTMKPHLQQHYARVVGTQMGDVYSFGIIMQEVVVRGEPYCMLSLSAEEIIAKIKKPPPLIRPSVSKGAAPPEAINIMRQCWAEQSEMRPDFNSVYERFKMLNHGRKVNFVDTMFQMLEKYSNNLEELIRERTEQLDLERKKTEQLLNRMLPSSVAEKLKMGLGVDPEEFSDVTIYFSDIVGFTTIAAHCSPVQVVDLLNDLYTIFDATINAYNVYKVETIGDAYMVVSGLPVKIPDHADQIATMALDLLHQSGRFNVKHLPGVPLQLRIGLHTGPCCAGVVGLTMPRYCLFGDTVNTASRMESTGSSWRIHMSQETRDRLEARGGYAIESRGLIDIKGKGMMHTYWLLGKKGFDKVMPTPPPIGECHGLDESFIRNSIILKAQNNKSRTSTNPSSSQSSSLAGESVEVKVEITPPSNVDIGSINLPNSYSLDSNSTTTISPNTTLCPEFPTKTPNASPQSRKLSELSPENLLNPSNFNRLPSSTGGSSSRLYKKLEEIMDISSPYNHYKCLSPSESNLTQFCTGKYLYSGSGIGAAGTVSGATSVHSSTTKFDSKPSSTRLLRRQFSLDRDDTTNKSDHHANKALQVTHAMSLTSKPSMLEIPIFHDTARSPKNTLGRTHKQNSNSIAQDLEKIEEIPLSPASSHHHSSLDSNMNKSPPSTVDGRSSQPTSQLVLKSTPPLFSAPTSPATTRSLNEPAGSPTTDASTATTTASTHSNNNANTNESNTNINKKELPLNAEALLSS